MRTLSSKCMVFGGCRLFSLFPILKNYLLHCAVVFYSCRSSCFALFQFCKVLLFTSLIIAQYLGFCFLFSLLLLLLNECNNLYKKNMVLFLSLSAQVKLCFLFLLFFFFLFLKNIVI